MILVIGAGVIGLASAVSLARKGFEVVVVEREHMIGQGVSSRNSQVIHGGMYYGTGTLRALHCVKGRRMLVERCLARGIPHKLTGKLIVATNDLELKKLEGIAAQAKVNDVEGMSFLSGKEAMALEPALFCVGALHSQATGIVDAHALMLSLQGELEDLGGAVALNSTVSKVEAHSGGFKVWVNGEMVECEGVVNAAALGAQTIAHTIEALEKRHIPTLHLAKGNYFSYSKPSVFSHLIYPAPIESGALGTHVTLDLDGRMKFGPDLEWVEAQDYAVNPSRAEGFYDAIRRYFPDLQDGTLQADYAGIRPKISGKDEVLKDFIIQDEETHRIPRLVNLFGIESPGLTSSLSIGDAIAEIFAIS